MELYFELLKKPVFSIADAEQFYKTKDQLEEQTVEDQVAMTEQILSKLQATKPMKLERNWKEKIDK